MTWSTHKQPFGVNRAPILTGLSSDNSGVDVPVAVDPVTGAILTESSGGGGGGTSSNFGATFPTAGTAIGATDGTNMQPLKVDGSDNLLVNVNAALPAGSNVIGHVITDTGSTTAVTGTVTANAGTNLNTSALALESGGNLATVAGTAIAQEATTSGVKGITAFGAVTTAAPSYTTAKSDALSLTTAGSLRVTATNMGPGAGIGDVRLINGSNVAAVDASGNQSMNLTLLAGNTISSGVGATGTGTLRMVVANDTGRTLVSKGGSASSSGDNTLVTAGTNRLKVYAFSLSTISATAVTCIFQSGAGGTELWRVLLQAPASVSTGANLVVQPPAWLFATASATLLNLNLSSANTVHWSVSYWDEA